MSIAALLAVAQIASVAYSAYSVYKQASMEKSLLEANERIAEYNRQIAERQAREAIERAQREAIVHRAKVDQMLGQQRVSTVARGLSIADSALDAELDTELTALVDFARIREAGEQEAYQHSLRAWEAGAQGAIARAKAKSINPTLGAVGTLLTQGGQVASKWYTYKQTAGKWWWE